MPDEFSQHVFEVLMKSTTLTNISLTAIVSSLLHLCYCFPSFLCCSRISRARSTQYIFSAFRRNTGNSLSHPICTLGIVTYNAYLPNHPLTLFSLWSNWFRSSTASSQVVQTANIHKTWIALPFLSLFWRHSWSDSALFSRSSWESPSPKIPLANLDYTLLEQASLWPSR